MSTSLIATPARSDGGAWFLWSLALAFGLRMLAVHVIPWHPWFDDAWYYRTGVQLAEGRGYLNDAGQATAYFPVGYPITLALVFRIFGASLRAAQYANIVFSIGTMIVIHQFARAFSFSARTASIAAVAWGFLPNQIASCCVTMAETTFTFALLLGLLFVVRPQPRVWSDALAGLILGWATLVRPQALLPGFLLIVAVALMRGSRPWSKSIVLRACIVALGIAAVVGPWSHRNYQTFGAFILVSTNGGENLLIGNHPDSQQHYGEPQWYYPRDVDFAHLSELERDRLGARLGLAYLKQRPFQAILRIPKKLWYMYRSDLGVTNWLWGGAGKSGTALYYVSQAITQLSYLLVLAAGALGLRQLLARDTIAHGRTFAVVALAVIGYFSAITALFFGDARYHQPVMPLFAIAAACCVDLALQRRGKSRDTPLASPHEV